MQIPQYGNPIFIASRIKCLEVLTKCKKNMQIIDAYSDELN